MDKCLGTVDYYAVLKVMVKELELGGIAKKEMVFKARRGKNTLISSMLPFPGTAFLPVLI